MVAVRRTSGVTARRRTEARWVIVPDCHSTVSGVKTSGGERLERPRSHARRLAPQGRISMAARTTTIALVVALAVAASSCATIEENPKAVLGTVIGGATGAGIAALAGGGTGAIVG